MEHATVFLVVKPKSKPDKSASLLYIDWLMWSSFFRVLEIL
jgi:hypothetical protein